MRIWSKARCAALLVPVVVMLAGCGGGSILPGHGGEGGLGTIGTDTSNPNEGLVFRVSGSSLGDFVADTVRFVGGNLQQIEAVQLAGRSQRPTKRTLGLRFETLPVAGRTYAIGSSSPDGVTLTYIETTPPDAASGARWEGVSGEVKIKAATAESVTGTFTARLDPVDPSQPALAFSSGAFHLKQ